MIGTAEKATIARNEENEEVAPIEIKCDNF